MRDFHAYNSIRFQGQENIIITFLEAPRPFHANKQQMRVADL